MNQTLRTEAAVPDTPLTPTPPAGDLRAVGDGREQVGSARRRFPLRALTLAIVALLLVITVVLTTIVRRVVDDQEDRLLDQRARELSTVLSSVIGPIETTMQSVAGLSLLSAGNPDLFDQATEPLQDRLGETLVLVSVDDTSAEVVAGSLDPGTPLDGEPLDAVQRATDEITTTPVFRGQGDQRKVGFAIRAGESTAVYTEFSFDPSEPNETTEGEPFADLNVALYASPEPAEDQLILATGTTPSGTDVAQESVEVGQETWTVTAEPRTSLVGSAADASPWIVLGAGLAITLIAGALTETLGRRQAYAQALVDQRTADLEEAQTQLVRSERLAAIGGLASAVGHELRNPLGVISNAHYLLRTKLGDGAEPDLRRHLATAERETAAATLIVSDLLEFARARDPIHTDVDLGDLIREALEVAPPPPDVEVHDDIEGGLVVRADRDQLRQVLLNLFTNAYDAMGDRGSLDIAAEQRDGSVSVTVGDTGPGVPDDDKPRIFEPFFTSKAKGIGLGLTVTKRIAEAHGGDLTVADRDGGGTEFRLVLPVPAAEDGDR